MKLSIYKYPEEEEQYMWTIELKDIYAELWYKEMIRRFWGLKNNPELAVFDIDCSYELWKISLWHLEEMIRFLKN